MTNEVLCILEMYTQTQFAYDERGTPIIWNISRRDLLHYSLKVPSISTQKCLNKNSNFFRDI